MPPVTAKRDPPILPSRKKRVGGYPPPLNLPPGDPTGGVPPSRILPDKIEQNLSRSYEMYYDASNQIK